MAAKLQKGILKKPTPMVKSKAKAKPKPKARFKSIIYHLGADGQVGPAPAQGKVSPTKASPGKFAMKATKASRESKDVLTIAESDEEPVINLSPRKVSTPKTLHELLLTLHLLGAGDQHTTPSTTYAMRLTSGMRNTHDSIIRLIFHNCWHETDNCRWLSAVVCFPEL